MFIAQLDSSTMNLFRNFSTFSTFSNQIWIFELFSNKNMQFTIYSWLQFKQFWLDCWASSLLWTMSQWYVVWLGCKNVVIAVVQTSISTFSRTRFSHKIINSQIQPVSFVFIHVHQGRPKILWKVLEHPNTAWSDTWYWFVSKFI